MAVVTFEQIVNANKDLLLKPLKGAVLVAPMTVPVPVEFTAGASAKFQSLEGYSSLGLIDKAGGPQFRPEQQLSETESWGWLEATRSDIVKRDMSASLTAQEFKRPVLELVSGRSLADVKADAVTKELSWNEPVAPDTIHYRIIFLFVDGVGAREKWVLRVMPRASVTEVGQQQWNSENIASWPITVKATVDDKLGYSLRNVLCGPGVADLVIPMGFSIASPPPAPPPAGGGTSGTPERAA
ncbi:phage tail tube protein [Nocardia xishanensis]